jgi:AcrR family transcriptional regulator
MEAFSVYQEAIFVTAESAPARKPRADAERNRQRLLEAARAAFNAGGTSVSLEEIARVAGVGIGTLYRHFPTRDFLVAQVYRNEAEKLGEAARQLAGSEPPLVALRAWLLLFVDYLSTKLILVEAFKSIVGDTSQLTAGSGDMLSSAVTLLVNRAVEAGDLAAGQIDPIDLLRAITGVAMAGAGPNWTPSARAMVDILIAGLKRG